MAENHNHNGNGGMGGQYGNGGVEQRYGNGGCGQARANGGYGQQLGNGAYGQPQRNNLNRQPLDTLRNGLLQDGRYAYQTQQLSHATERPNVLIPNVNQQQPAAQGFQTQVRVVNGTNRTNYTPRVVPNPNAQPFVPLGGAPNVNAQPFVPRETQRPPPPLNAKVWVGDDNLPYMPGFVEAALGSPMFGNEDQQLPLPDCLTFSEQCEREADAGCMTPESAVAFWKAENEKLQNQQNQRTARPHHQTAQQHAPRPAQTPAGIRLDIQQSVGKITTGKCVYRIEGTIEPGGDPMRMSDGIHVVRHPSGIPIGGLEGLRVAKLLKPTHPAQFERAHAERDILKKLQDINSPHVNYMYETHWPNGAEHCIFVLEYCDGGSIEKRIRTQQQIGVKFSEGFMWHFIGHMSSALAACHNGIRNPLKKGLQPKSWNCIAHLDIKPANVFISMKRAKGMEDDEYPTIVLGDFGCAVTADDILQGKFNKRIQPFGTELWYAPETKATTGKHAGRYGKSSDIWQLGALVSCMCRLVQIPDYNALYSAQPLGPGYSAELNKVVKWCFDWDLEKRPNAVDIIERMVAMKKLVVED